MEMLFQTTGMGTKAWGRIPYSGWCASLRGERQFTRAHRKEIKRGQIAGLLSKTCILSTQERK